MFLAKNTGWMVYLVDMKGYENKELDSKIFIEDSVYKRLLATQKESHPMETGGIIIGYYDTEYRNAIITECTCPPEDSKASKNHFFRGTKGLKSLLKRKWDEEKEYYLGEWHLHPGSSPNPSTTDIDQMKKIEYDSKFNCKEPILLILGEKFDSSVLNLILFKNNKQYFYTEMKEVES